MRRLRIFDCLSHAPGTPILFCFHALFSVFHRNPLIVLQWKKIDLSPEVIRKAAPDVREIHLYWSGQDSVLRGWSEEEGLPQLKGLQKIVLHVQQVSQNDQFFQGSIAVHFLIGVTEGDNRSTSENR